jgi:hypothetical protein
MLSSIIILSLSSGRISFDELYNTKIATITTRDRDINRILIICVALDFFTLPPGGADLLWGAPPPVGAVLPCEDLF